MLENAEDILSTEDRPTKTIHVDPWDTDVRIRALGGYSRSVIEEIGAKMQSGEADRGVMWEFYSHVVIHGIIDSNGNRVFNEGHSEKLKDKSAAGIEQISDAVLEISGMNPEDIEEAAGN